MIESIVNFFTAITEFLYSLLLTSFDMFKDLFYFIFESCLALVLVALNGLGSLLNGLSISQYFDAIPAEVRNVLALIGLDVALGMIVASILLRLTLQLIPFTRLGS